MGYGRLKVPSIPSKSVKLLFIIFFPPFGDEVVVVITPDAELLL